jgi:hypothetical protein
MATKEKPYIGRVELHDTPSACMNIYQRAQTRQKTTTRLINPIEIVKTLPGFPGMGK